MSCANLCYGFQDTRPYRTPIGSRMRKPTPIFRGRLVSAPIVVGLLICGLWFDSHPAHQVPINQQLSLAVTHVYRTVRNLQVVRSSSNENRQILLTIFSIRTTLPGPGAGPCATDVQPIPVTVRQRA
jgi:hypothetical protein